MPRSASLTSADSSGREIERTGLKSRIRRHRPQLGQLMVLSESGRADLWEAAHDNAERSKPSPRIFGKRHGTPEACGCGDNRGGVCLDGATSFVKCQVLRRSSHGRRTSRLDRSHHHRRSCRRLAEQFMKSEMGILMNIVLGVIGAAIASAILSFFGVNLGGWIGYLIAGFIGACLLIWIYRVIQTRRPA